MFDFRSSPEPTTVPDLWARLVRFVRSMSDGDTLKAVPLSKVGLNVIPHFKTTAPKAVTCQLVGDSAGAAVITVGEVGPRFVNIYTTVVCVVDVHLVL